MREQNFLNQTTDLFAGSISPIHSPRALLPCYLYLCELVGKENQRMTEDETPINSAVKNDSKYQIPNNIIKLGF